MVKHRHELAATVADEQALDLVRRQWAVHQKLIDRNYVNHTEVYGILRRVVG